MLNRMFFAQNVSQMPPIGLGYGRLYNWYAASNNIAPAGWRIPTENDFNVLINYLGGSSVAGGKLKLTGTTYWDSPNTGATDDYGLNVMGAGERMVDGTYTLLKQSTRLITSTTPIAPDYFVLSLYMEYARSQAYISYYYIGRNVGHSIRLIKEDSINPSTIVDYDGNVYNTVTIGTQIWTKENWKCTKYNDGTSIPNVTDNTTWAALTTGAMCAYNNDENNV